MGSRWKPIGRRRLKKSETADKISAAELALKTADTVQASTYANAAYTAAADTLARAEAELQQGTSGRADERRHCQEEGRGGRRRRAADLRRKDQG